MDIVSPETRSRMMAGIRSRNTRPEMVIRRGLFSKGLRYRLHDGRLPGRPDLVFPSYRAAVFVSGCFWHGHECHLFKWPAANAQFWRTKIVANRERDRAVRESLRKDGWRVATVWECALRDKRPEEIESVVDELARWVRSEVPELELADAEHQ